MEGFSTAKKLKKLVEDLNLCHAFLVAVHHQIDPYAQGGIDAITLYETVIAKETMFAEYYGNPRCASILARIHDICYEFEAIRDSLRKDEVVA